MTPKTALSFVTFKPLTQAHLPLLEAWLAQDSTNLAQNSFLSLEALKTQTQNLIKGVIRIDDEDKPLKAFVIYENDDPSGYIQFYQTTKQPRLGAGLGVLFKQPLSEDLDKECSFIELFLDNYLFEEYSFCIVDIDADNLRFITLFEHLGFKIHTHMGDFLLMIKKMLFKIKTPKK